MTVDEIKVAGDPATRAVHVVFADIDWEIPPSVARELAFALMTQADRAEGPVDAVRVLRNAGAQFFGDPPLHHPQQIFGVNVEDLKDSK